MVLMQTLIRLTQVSVTRSGRQLIHPMDWELKRGQHVALTGPNGSGKTTLLRVLRGDLLPDRGGERIYDFGNGPQHTVLGLRQRITMVSADMQDFYFLHATRTMGRDVVLSGFFDTPLLYEKTTAEQNSAAGAVIDLLGLHELAHQEMGALSTGQVRKLLIARALVSSPDVVLLDECLEGLDTDSRNDVLVLLDKAAEQATLVCAAHRVGDLPECISSTIVLSEGMISSQGNRDDALNELQERTPALAACDIPVMSEKHDYEYLLRMKNVSVMADGTRILHSIDWEILPGENWAVLGHNGAGKSTLIKLIMSEIAPYADGEQGVGVIQRLGGMTMDEARPLIGLVSPALQANYARELGWEVTAEETVLSGYRGSVGMLDEPTSEEMLGAREWLDRVGLAGLGNRRLRHMSYGQQRRVLLARAMAPGPQLLLLDEPLAGLDSESRVFMRNIMQRLAETGTPIVLVTHHDEDLIDVVNKVLVLKNGRIVTSGAREQCEISVDLLNESF